MRYLGYVAGAGFMFRECFVAVLGYGGGWAWIVGEKDVGL